jgi:cytochrome b561
MKSSALTGAMPLSGARPPASAVIRDYRMPAKVFHWVTVALVFFMVASGVTATQLGDGPVADALLKLHRLTGALTLALILVRLGYRLMRAMPRPPLQSWTRPLLHGTLYGIIILVPLLGWAGASDFGHTEIPFGLELPPILPAGTGWGDLLVRYHAYVAFALLALVALHIGAAMHDYMLGDAAAEPKD